MGSAPKFTPGPWRWYQASANVSRLTFAVDNADGRVATLATDEHRRAAENARLIAAAPEMHEITKGVEKCDACDGDGRHRHLNDEYADNRTCSACGGTGAVLGRSVTWQMVQAALAKAEGK